MLAGGRRLATPRLSPDGSRLAFVCADGGDRRLLLTAAAGGSELDLGLDPAPATGDGSIVWLPDGSGLVYVGAEGGLFVTDLHGPGRPVGGVDLGADVAAPAVSPDGRWVAVVVGQRRVVVVALQAEVAAAPAVELTVDADFAFDPAWSADSQRVAWHEWDVPAMPWDSSRIVVRAADGSGRPHLLAGGRGVAVGQPRFSPDGSRIAYLSDAGGWYQVWVASAADGGDARPLVEEPYEHSPPAWGPGSRSFSWAPDGQSIAHLRNELGFARLVLVHLATGWQREIAKGVHRDLHWEGERLSALRSGARTPEQVVTYTTTGLAERVAEGPGVDIEELLDDMQRHDPSLTDERVVELRRTLEARVRSGFAPVVVPFDERPERAVVARGLALEAASRLPEPEVVRFAAFDGAQLVGRLHRPTSRPLGEPPPMLLWVHGGPTGQALVGFDPKLAYFVDRGWAVLVPDFRGSTGHGRAVTQALRGQWGALDVDDCAAALEAAAARGWGDPERLVPIGSSSGGMTVLLLLAHHGALCAAGVDQYGVTDLHGLAESTHRFEAHYNDSLVGPLPGAAATWRERSPLTHVDRITAPLLVLHGDADDVVPLSQSQSVVERLRALGRPVELHLFEGEGHGFRRPESVVRALELIDDFLRRHVLDADRGDPHRP